jgi:hypothetical protein
MVPQMHRLQKSWGARVDRIRTLPQALCCAQVNRPGGFTSVHGEEVGSTCGACWLQRPQVAAHQPAVRIQAAPHWPQAFFWAQVLPSLGCTSLHVPEGVGVACWLQRPQVAAHQSFVVIQPALHWPQAFFCAQVLPSAQWTSGGRRQFKLQKMAAQHGQRSKQRR